MFTTTQERRVTARMIAIAITLLCAIQVLVATQPAQASPVTTTITVAPSQVINNDFYGVGVDVIPAVLMENNRSKGYDEGYWEIDKERIHSLQPKVARVWFQPDWFETAKGVYDWNTPKMQAFYSYLDVLKAAGTEVEFNYGWKVSRAAQSWFSLPGVPARISAPADLDDFAAAGSAVLNELITQRGYSNIKYLTFYNEPNGSWDFEAPGDQQAYYAQMARAVHNKLIADGRRNLVKIWGPEEWNAASWTQYMAQNADDVFDAYSFHVYGGTYSGLSSEISTRRAAIGSKPLIMSEFGFQGTYDSWWDAGYGNYIIKAANEGLSSALIWQLNGVWVEDPDEDTDTNDTYTLWDTVLTAQSPNPRYYEAGLLLRYVPAHSQVLQTVTSTDDVRAATFRNSAGDYTIVVETNENADPRTLQFDFSGLGVNKTFHRMVYNDAVTPEPHAALPGVSANFSATTGFTDSGVSAQRNVIVYTTLAPEGQVSVSPTRASISGGQSVSLSSAVSDLGGTGVTWSVVGSGNGSVTSGGVYTAPSVLAPRNVAVRATSTVDASVYGVALIHVSPASTSARVDIPVFDLAAATYRGNQTVTITSGTSGATIRYTVDGSTPGPTSPVYSGPLTLSSTTVLKAVAVKSGLTDSAIAQRIYRILPAENGPAGSTFCGYQDAVCAFPGIATVYYGANGTYYSAVFDRRTRCDDRTFGGDPTPGTHKRCYYLPTSANLATKPAISPQSGNYWEPKTVTITAAAGSQIRYTTNGALPTASSPLYTGPFQVATVTTVKAVAVTSGLGTSPVSIAYLDVIDTTGGPSGYTYCATEFSSCQFSGTATVAFGGNGSFATGTFTDGVLCAASNFGGDPAPGVAKKCYYQLGGGGGIVAAPTFSPAGGSYTGTQTVTIASTTSGAQIRYTTDGSTPTASSSLYSGGITVSSSQTIKAIAIKSGLTTSAVVSASYTITPAGPGDGPAGYTYCASEFGTCLFSGTASVAYGAGTSFVYGTFTGQASCTTATFGSDPTPGIAKKCYYLSQSVAAAPTFSPVGGTYSQAQQVTLSSSTSGATIHYTTDGSTPTASSPLFSAPITVATSQTIKAIAVKSGLANSAVASAAYTIQAAGGDGPAGYTYCANEFGTCLFSGTASVAFGANGSYYYGTFTGQATCSAASFGGDPAYNQAKKCYYQAVTQAAAPTFTPAAGTYSSTQSVTISSATSGAQIRYTTNGSTPTASSTLYTGPISVATSQTIKAIAVKSGLADSAVTTAAYTIQAPSGDGPAGYTYCANEFGTCMFSGTASVAFGANGSYYYGTFTNQATCSSGSFGGDPAYNQAKKCYYLLS